MTIRVFPLICLAALLALFAGAGVAQAEVPRLVPNGNFAAADGPLGVAVDNSCSLHMPPLTGSACTAFDPSAGDLYAAGFLKYGEVVEAGGKTKIGQVGTGSIEKFDATGGLLTPSPFDEAPNYGAAVNPTNGHLYVASALGAIQTYDPNTGLLLPSSFTVPPFWTGDNEPFENLAQIATDSTGNVYVPNVPSNEVLEYSQSGVFVMALGKEVDKTKVELREKEEANHEPVTVTKELEDVCTGTSGDTCGPGSRASGAGALSKPTGVAVAPSGDVWVADDGNNRIEEFGPTGAFLSEFESEGVRSLALYEHEGAVDVLAIVNNSADFCGSLASPCAHLVEYSPTGVQLADLGAGEFGAVAELNIADPYDMVAVDQASGRVYVTDAVHSVVWVFQPPLAPVLGTESAAEVGTSEAKLGAVVNPGGIGTRYRFEYDTREYAEGEGPHGVSVPFPEGSVGEGFSSRTVWASAKGLAPGTTYHYRVIVANALGTVVGPDQTFTTETAAQTACPNEQLRGGFSAALPDCRAYELVTTPTTTSAQPDGEHIWGGFSPGGGVTNNYAARDGNRMSYLSAEVLPGSRSAGVEYVATRGTGGWSSEDVIPLQPYTGDRCPIEAPTSEVKAYSADLSKAVVRDGGNGVEGGCRGEAVEVVKGEPLGVENLLLRDNTNGTYQLINVAPPGVAPTDAHFVGASADLSRVVFSERAKLTPDALSNVENLYEFSEGVVRLLTVLPDGAPVAGSFVSISPEGSDVFFTAGGNLYVRLNGERTVQVDQARGGLGPGGGGSFAAVTADGSEVFFTDEASAGLTSDSRPSSGANLYRYDVDTGQLSDLTPLSDAKAALAGISEDASYVYYYAETALSGSQSNQLGETAQDGKPNLYLEHEGTITFIAHEGVGVGQMSPSGAFFAFDSAASLTGYDNAGNTEIYLYSAALNRFVCASCNPSGEAPTAGGVSIGGAPHSVSDNGQVFFQTGEALLPRDTDGVGDVYEYDYAGGLHLISAGTSSSPSTLLDASESGDDVFFLTRQKLLPQDTNEEALSIYDARVDGGFPESSSQSCTTPEACRGSGSPQPSIFGAPASQTFSGVGNLTPPPTAKLVVKPETRAQKLAKALTTCKKDKRKAKRKACESKARKQFGTAKQAKRANRNRRPSR